MNLPDDVAAKINELARKLDTVDVYEKIRITKEMQRLVAEAATRTNGSSASGVGSAVAASH